MTDPIYEILERFGREGIESVTADDSAEIKGFIRERGFDDPTSIRLVEAFPVEASEALDELDR